MSFDGNYMMKQRIIVDSRIYIDQTSPHPTINLTSDITHYWTIHYLYNVYASHAYSKNHICGSSQTYSNVKRL